MSSLRTDACVIPGNAIDSLGVLVDHLEQEETKAECGTAAKDAECVAALGKPNGYKSAYAALALWLLWYPLAFLTIHQAHFALPAESARSGE